MKKRFVLIGGGVRSGKSAWALRLARRLGPRRTFVATAQAFDDEMRQRIASHISERGDDFTTLEVPRALPETLGSLRDTDVVVVDCLTLWLCNLLMEETSDAGMNAQLTSLVAALQERACHVVVVTNEVGMGVVPESALGRRFRDVSGQAHQLLSAEADEVYAAMLGCILRLHPAPVALQHPGDLR